MQQVRWILVGCALALATAATPAGAVAKKPAKKPATRSRSAPASAATTKIAEPTAPARPGGFMVPQAVVLRTTTKAEDEANAVWNVRAALNIAALQCQFSPFLATVKNYNDLLKHHGEEITSAQMTMIAHFKRYDGARAANNFDQYTTRTYNSYSTLDAQYSFCDAAALVGRQLLTIPKGQLGAIAKIDNPVMRASLVPKPLSPALAEIDIAPLAVEPISTD